MTSETIERADLGSALDIVLEACNDPAGVIDGTFRADMLRQLELIFDVRKAQAIHPYKIDGIRCVVHGAATAAQLHSGQTRDSGEDYFRTHCRGIVDSLVEDLGRTAVPLIVAGYTHDAIENVLSRRGGGSAALRERMIATYKPEHVEPLLRTIHHAVGLTSALTKTKIKGDRAATSGGALLRILEATGKLGPNAIHVKCADRRDNARDEWAHKSRDARERQARETHEVHAYLAALLGSERMAGLLVDPSAKVLNPDLFRGYYDLQEQRRKQRVGRAFDLLKDEVLAPGAQSDARKRGFLENAIVDVRLAPVPLAKFVLPVNRPLEDLDLDSFHIHSVAPLHCIDVITSSRERYDAVIDHIRRNFLRAGEIDELERCDEEKLPYSGWMMTVYSQRFGELKIQIIDKVSYACMPRGKVPAGNPDPFDRAVLSPDMQAAISRVVKETGNDPRRTRPLAHKYLLRSDMRIFTRDREPVDFPADATGFDLTAFVRGDFTPGLTDLHSLQANDTYVRVSRFVPLRPDGRYEFVSCMSGQDPDLARLADCRPSWRIFCATEKARQGIGKFLHADEHRGVVFDIEQRGRDYVTHLASTFGLSEKEVINAAMNDKLWEKVAKEIKLFFEGDDEAEGRSVTVLSRILGLPANEVVEILRKPDETGEDRILYRLIGQGDIEPVSILSTRYFDGKKIWRVRIELPNQPGTLDSILEVLKRLDINIESILQIPRPLPKTHIVRLEMSDFTDEKSPFDMMKIVLALAEDYRTEMPYRNFAKRIGVGIADLIGLAQHSLRRALAGQ